MDFSNIVSDKLISFNNTNSLGIFPHYLIEQYKLYDYIETAKGICWEKDGLNLLSKIYFSKQDIEIYKSLLINNYIPPKYKGELKEIYIFQYLV